MKTQNHPGLIGPVDDLRRKRLLDLAELARSSRSQTVDLEWPDYSALERAALNDLALDGPKTILPLARQLSGYSQMIRAGVPVIPETTFQDLVVPTLDRSLEAEWGSTSPDIGNNGISVAMPSPRRLSCFVVVSQQVRVQNDLLAGAWLEQQLLASLGRALDKAAIAGTGTGDQPTGILNDPDVLTHERASAGTNSLADLCGMEQDIADANSDDGAENLLWIADTATRSDLRQKAGSSGLGEVFGEPVWEGAGPLGYDGIASVHAPANTLALVRKNALAFMDFSKIKIESLIDRTEAIAGLTTMIVTAWMDFVTLDPTGVVIATDPA